MLGRYSICILYSVCTFCCCIYTNRLVFAIVYEGGICFGLNEFRMSGIKYNVLYRRNVRRYIIFNVSIKLYKTRSWFNTPLWLYTFEIRGS